MKKLLMIALLALALPTAVFAGSTDYTNSGGTLAGSNGGLTLSGSVLVAVNGNGGLITGNDLGSVSFTTGALISGSLQTGGTFASGGSFTITANGTGGLPDGTIFSGSFSGPVTWTMVTLANGTHNYTLTGSLTGTTASGASVNGVTVQLTVNTGKGYFNGTTRVSSGDTNVGSVPEPGSLTLMGTGLIALGGMIRRKLKA